MTAFSWPGSYVALGVIPWYEAKYVVMWSADLEMGFEMCWEVVPTHLRSCSSCFVAGHPRLGWERGPSLTGSLWMHLVALSVFQQSFYAPERTDTCVPPRKARLHVLLLIWNDVSPSLQNGHLLFGFLVLFWGGSRELSLNIRFSGGDEPCPPCELSCPLCFLFHQAGGGSREREEKRSWPLPALCPGKLLD